MEIQLIKRTEAFKIQTAQICHFTEYCVLKMPPLRTRLCPTVDTAPSEGFFSVTFGPFASDVSLRKVTIDSGGDLLTWTQSRQTQSDADLAVSRIAHVNGTYSFRLSFPLSHRKIIPEVRNIKRLHRVKK